MSVEEELLQKVRVVDDFPKKGVKFIDISSLTSNRELFGKIVGSLATRIRDNVSSTDFVLVGIESRGFLFASALSLVMNTPFVLARKKGKLPYDTYSAKCTQEYGSAEFEMNTDDIIAGNHYILVDDIIATGGTLSAIEDLITSHGGVVDLALGVYSVGSCKALATKNIKCPIQTLCQF